jgi:hypothetical protein
MPDFQGNQVFIHLIDLIRQTMGGSPPERLTFRCLSKTGEIAAIWWTCSARQRSAEYISEILSHLYGVDWS